MTVNYINIYSVEEYKHSEKLFESSFDKKVINEYIIILDGETFSSEKDLREDFEYYLADTKNIVPPMAANEDLDDYSLSFQITNWDEILPELAFLIMPKKEYTCCELAPFGANFCPTCGKPIIIEE